MKDLDYFLSEYSSITYYIKSQDASYNFDLPLRIQANSLIIINKKKDENKFNILKCRFHSCLVWLNRKELNYFLTSYEPKIADQHIERERKIVA